MAQSTSGRLENGCRSMRLAVLVAGSVLLGCGPEEQIRHYKVPKPELIYAQNNVDAGTTSTEFGEQRSGPTDRLLGAIVPHGGRTWYFKMTGPAGLVAQQEQPFRELIESLTFESPDATPKWKLPDSWEENEGSGQRLATLSVEVEGQKLEVSVIQLPTNPAASSVLDNVNRWRRQMRLPEIGPQQLETDTDVVTLSDGTAFLVNLVGTFTSGSMSAGSLPQTRTAAQPGRDSNSVEPGLQCEIPDGWSRHTPVTFSALTLEMVDGNESAQITVSPLRGDGGGLLPNVNRWRRQVGLAPIDQDGLAGATDQVEVDGIDGTYTEALGNDGQTPGKAIVGWIGTHANRSWFIKMAGDLQLVRDQRESFRSFLKTLKFNAS